MKTPPPCRSLDLPNRPRRLLRRSVPPLLSTVLSTLLAAGCVSSGAAQSGQTPPAPKTPAAAAARAAKPGKASAPAKPAAKSAAKPPAQKPVRETAGEAGAVAAAVEELAPRVEVRLRERFAAAGRAYPPKELALLAFKTERSLEVWAEGGAPPAKVWTYPLLDSSPPGPKLEQGDWQIPEGVYRVTWLNPKSDYHLSLALDYPNDFDRAKAAADKRTDLGGDIFIHGKDTSIGCLAIGDPAVEELFVLVARVGPANVRVLIAPDDLRSKPAPAPKVAVEWIDELYGVLRRELARYPASAAPAPADAPATGGRSGRAAPASSSARPAAAAIIPSRKAGER